MTKSEVSRRIKGIIGTYLAAANIKCPSLNPSTRLVRDTALSSDDGVNLVLDICADFGISLPDDFNSIVHDDGKSDRTFGELVAHVEKIVDLKEQSK